MAGYNWILTPASIFVGHYLKEFYSKFENILTDSLSVVKMLENTIFDRNCFLFTIDFKSLYTNISVKDAIYQNDENIVFQISKLFSKIKAFFKDLILNAHFIMEFVLNSAVLKFQEEFFLQILGIFSTNPRNRNGNKFSTHISQHIHGYARRRIIYYMQKQKHYMA